MRVHLVIDPDGVEERHCERAKVGEVEVEAAALHGGDSGNMQRRRQADKGGGDGDGDGAEPGGAGQRMDGARRRVWQEEEEARAGGHAEGADVERRRREHQQRVESTEAARRRRLRQPGHNIHTLIRNRGNNVKDANGDFEFQFFALDLALFGDTNSKLTNRMRRIEQKLRGDRDQCAQL
eukprot:6183230-Pleurochrysis_carterae.AAC.2